MGTSDKRGQSGPHRRKGAAMNGVNPMYDTVTRVQHQEDIRRAAKFRLIKDARRRTGSIGFVSKILGRFTGSDEAVVDCAPECNPRTAS
jgi:hypothetical protein